jgi:polysaccharide chain length determinant protein (PEP-CTERM system associated)
MYELLIETLAQLRGAWRYRWQALFLAWGLFLIGTVVVYLVPDRYEVRAQVFVDTDSVLKPLLQGLAVNTPVMTQVNMMTQALLSQPQLERVIRETDLHLRATTAPEMEQLIEELRLRIRLIGGSRESLYQISYEDTDRQVAYSVVNTLLNAFVENTWSINRADSDSAQRFLESQIATLEERLRAAEDRLAEFKKKNVGLMPGERGDYYTRLQQAMEQLGALQAEQAIQQTRYDQLSRQLEGEQPTFGILSAQGTGGARVAQLEEQLEKLLTRYTEKHPDVAALREQIEIELQRAEQHEQPSSGPVVANAETLALNALDLNPVYQRMKIDLNETEVRLGETAKKIAEQERAVGQLRSLVGTIPEVEAELSRLNRDYEVTRAQHTALLQRLESARLSEQAERDTEEVKFRVIQPPTVPLLPVGPNRPPLLAAVLALALAGSGALAFVLHQINPVFSTRRMVRERLGLPVIGVVSMVRDRAAAAAARRKRFVFASGFLLLLVTFAAAYALVGVGGTALRALVGGGVA